MFTCATIYVYYVNLTGSTRKTLLEIFLGSLESIFVSGEEDLNELRSLLVHLKHLRNTFETFADEIRKKVINVEQSMQHQFENDFRLVETSMSSKVSALEQTMFTVKTEIVDSVSSSVQRVKRDVEAVREDGKEVLSFLTRARDELWVVVKYVAIFLVAGVAVYLLVYIGPCLRPFLELCGTCFAFCNTLFGMMVDALSSKRRQMANRRAEARVQLMELARRQISNA